MRYLGAEPCRLRAVLAQSRRVQPSSYTTDRSLNSCVPSPEHWFARRARLQSFLSEQVLQRYVVAHNVREQLP